jgi:hypothetical protein
MTQRIIYNQLDQDGNVTWPAELTPSPEAVEKYGIMAVAIKDVPAGRPFKIVDAADLPDAPIETWMVDDADLTDGVGGESSAFPETFEAPFSRGGRQ